MPLENKHNITRSPKIGHCHNYPARRYWDLFPTLKFEEPVVYINYINDGNTPDSPYPLAGLLSIIAGLLWFLFLS